MLNVNHNCSHKELLVVLCESPIFCLPGVGISKLVYSTGVQFTTNCLLSVLPVIVETHVFNITFILNP